AFPVGLGLELPIRPVASLERRAVRAVDLDELAAIVIPICGEVTIRVCDRLYVAIGIIGPGRLCTDTELLGGQHITEGVGSEQRPVGQEAERVGIRAMSEDVVWCKAQGLPANIVEEGQGGVPQRVRHRGAEAIRVVRVLPDLLIWVCHLRYVPGVL